MEINRAGGTAWRETLRPGCLPWGWNSSLHHHGHVKAPLHKTLWGVFSSRIAFLLGQDFCSRLVSAEHPLNQILISKDYYNNSKNHPLTVRALEREHKGLENAMCTCWQHSSRLLRVSAHQTTSRNVSILCWRLCCVAEEEWQSVDVMARWDFRQIKIQIHNHSGSAWCLQGGGRGIVRNCPFGVVTRAGSSLWFPELFGMVEVKTTCADRELGESVHTFIIYKIAVQRQIAWNPLKGEIPAPSGSCLAQAFSTGRKGRGKKNHFHF